MAANDWPIVTDAEGYFRQNEKRLLHEERRPLVKTASDLMGPGIAPHAVLIFDWNNEVTAFNGFYYSEPGAMNTPDGTSATNFWMGQSIADAEGNGVQFIWINRHGNLQEPLSLRARRFHGSEGGQRQFSAWQEIEGGGGGSALAVQDEGTTVSGTVTQMDFVGEGVSVSAGIGEVVVDIPRVQFHNTDVFTLEDGGAQILPHLTWEPVAESVHVFINGLSQIRGTDWEMTGVPTKVELLTAEPQVGDAVSVTYAHWAVDAPDNPVDSPFAIEAMADGPILYWKMDEDTGTIAFDYSGNDRDGTYGGGFTLDLAKLASGLSEGVVDFANGSVSIADAAWQKPAAFSAELWIVADSASAGAHLFGVYGGGDSSRVWALGLNNNGLVGYIGTDGTLGSISTAIGSIANGTVYQVGLDYDGTTYRLIRNGELVASGTKTGVLNSSTAGLTLGNDVNGRNFDGRAQEAVLYNKKLSITRWYQHYLAGTGLSPTYSGLVKSMEPRVYYRMGEASGTTMIDSSTSARNGTYNGPTLSATSLLVGDTNTAVTFDGVNDYANFAEGYSANTLLTGGPNITLSMLIKPNSISGLQELWSRDHGTWTGAQGRYYRLRLNAGKPELIFWATENNNTMSTLTSPTTLTIGQTYRLIATYDGTTARIYINGVLDSSLAVTGAIANRDFSIDIVFGKDPTSAANYYNGVMDEVFFLPRAITQSEVTQLEEAAT
jgi:hypothetical protein